MKQVRQLAGQFQPEHYRLELRPDRDVMNFRGEVTIIGQKIGRPSQRLTFHQKDLRILNAKIIKQDKHGKKEVKVSRINYQRAFDEVRLHCDKLIYPGSYEVTLEFTGRITRSMNGIYPCFYKSDGFDKKLIATQFESHHAREVFPCIDEPAAKAVFELITTTPLGETVLSNTPIRKQTTKDKDLITTFETTPKMSTYLLALIYGELDYLEAKTKDGVKVRTYATKDNIKFCRFALDAAVKCLEFYNDYFNLPYPLAKCDLVALPDFAAGAMENWGLVTFREQALLVDPDNTSLSSKQYVAMVVAHELAHQWFGNLVTMRWWTDLWLNEGFASWIEYLAVDHLFPKWQMWTQFISSEQQTALKLDALEHTHPIEVPVRHPDEISTIFDTISYGKGASVIHMLHEYLGPDIFRDGLRLYLKKHQYGNTDTIDLWSALEVVAKKPVKQFMHAWTSQSGFPIVKAKIAHQKLEVTQDRFYINPKANKQSTTWPVPLHAGGELTDLVLSKKKSSWPLPPKSSFTKFNLGQGGFYRLAYDSAQLQNLSSVVRPGKLEPLDRLGLLSDSFEAAKAGHIETAKALRLLKAYIHEDNTAVWEIMVSNLASLRSVMADEELREFMKPLGRQLSAAQVKRLGWTGSKSEAHFDSLLRPIVLALASVSDDASVDKHALKLFSTLKRPDDINEIEPDLRGVVYGTAVRKGGQAEFDKLLAMHDATTNSEERTTIAAAITGFKQPELIKAALSQIKSDNVRLQDISYWIAYSFMNRHGKMQTWDWLVENWQWLDQNIGADLSFSRFPLYAARAFSDRSFLKQYQQFFNSVMSPKLERSVKQGIETIEWQSAWRTRDFKSVKQFFKSG